MKSLFPSFVTSKIEPHVGTNPLLKCTMMGHTSCGFLEKESNIFWWDARHDVHRSHALYWTKLMNVTAGGQLFVL